MKSTKMIFTLGPATDKPGVLAALLRGGMDGARFNFSHGEYPEHARRLRELAAECRRSGRTVARIQDLSGPKLRVGKMKNGKLPLRRGQEIVLTTRNILGEAGRVPIQYAGLAREAKPGHRILLDDGQMELAVVRARGQDLVCRVKTGGVLQDHKGLNVPEIATHLPALTAKDIRDLEFGIKVGFDYAALSFVRSEQDILALRKRIDRAGSPIKIIAKIERPQALPHLEKIIAAADGIMIARGDLGVELKPECVPTLQKEIIAAANRHGRMVITATQMLQSMVANPVPTRAEASDVANAIFDGTDAVMLSGETAAGEYPVEAGQTMARIIRQAEAAPQYNRLRLPEGNALPGEAVVAAGAHLAETVGAGALVVFTQSGETARLVSRLRPRVPVFALAHDEAVRRQLQLYWGLNTLRIRQRPEIEAVMQEVDACLLEQRRLPRGSRVVILASTPVRSRSRVNFIKVHTLGE